MTNWLTPQVVITQKGIQLKVALPLTTASALHPYTPIIG